MDIAPSALRALWPQSQSLLNSTLIERGVEHAGDDSRLACVRAALGRSARVSVSAVGGSITAGSSYAAGSGSGATFLYHRKLLMALDARFPVATGHGHMNGGVPGTGPTYMEHCVHDHLPPDVDLVLLEYAVNTDRRPASFERLLRTLLLHPRSPAVIVVNAHRWRAIRPHDGRTDKCWHKNWPVDMATNRTQWLAQSTGRVGAPSTDLLASDEDAIADLCRHYNVPLVSMRSALVDAVRAGEVAIPTFMNDCKHPTGVGHTFLAQLLLHRLLHAPSPAAPPSTAATGAVDNPAGSDHEAADTAAMGGGAGGSAGAGGGCAPPAARRVLRDPFYAADGRESASSVCARGHQLSRYVEPARLNGFNLTDEGRGKGKLGYLGYGLGKSLSFCLPWPAEGAPVRPPSVLWVGFLRSYEHMGRARVSCSGACGCAGDVIDGHDIKDGVSVTDVRKVGLRPARRGRAADATDEPAIGADGTACCRVQLTIAPGTSSGEHKFKVMSLLLGGSDAHSLQVFSLRVAASASETPAAAAAPKLRGGRRGERRRARLARGVSATTA